MFFYIIQTIFLLLIAFALGALVGYLLKRYFGCPAETQNDFSAGGTASTSSASTTSTLAASQSSVSSETSSAATPASGLMASADTSSSSDADTDTGADEGADKAASEEAETKSTAKAAAPKKTATAKKTTTAKKATAPTKKAAASKPAAKKPAAKKPAAKKPAAKKPAAAAASAPDDLKLIKGVGKLNETRLNEEGITTFAQVAAWKKADIAAFDEKLNFKGRIEREEWVPQAKALAKEAAKKKPVSAASTAAKKAAAPKAVAAKAPAAKKAPAKKPAAKKPAAKKPAAKKAAPAKPDDLKLIKGVGKLIETKLAKEGITQYSQIAAWKKADIADFDEKLSFKGRIERDEWVSQAKILAKGGTTEFSKRASKGDVPSSS